MDRQHVFPPFGDLHKQINIQVIRAQSKKSPSPPPEPVPPPPKHDPSTNVTSSLAAIDKAINTKTNSQKDLMKKEHGRMIANLMKHGEETFINLIRKDDLLFLANIMYCPIPSDPSLPSSSKSCDTMLRPTSLCHGTGVHRTFNEEKTKLMDLMKKLSCAFSIGSLGSYSMHGGSVASRRNEEQIALTRSVSSGALLEPFSIGRKKTTERMSSSVIEDCAFYPTPYEMT